MRCVTSPSLDSYLLQESKEYEPQTSVVWQLKGSNRITDQQKFHVFWDFVAGRQCRDKDSYICGNKQFTGSEVDGKLDCTAVCASFGKRVQNTLANEAYVYGWTLGESKLRKWGIHAVWGTVRRRFHIRSIIQRYFVHGIRFFPPKSSVLSCRGHLGGIMEIRFAENRRWGNTD